jgi:2-polyprenyl-3-methyl-5-hydroxy-6-metoxy-1,4-benzoquinol methylase
VSQTDGPIGNYYDKYGSTNAITRRLMVGFEGALDGLLHRVEPASILDVGCGEGVVTERWARALPDSRLTGLDLQSAELAAQWATRSLPNLTFLAGSATQLPFANDEFELVSGIEMLEHVPDPESVLAEMSRVASSHLLVSVPREPLWRALNMARGAYWAELGNTPGHVNHWSLAQFVEVCGRYGQVESVASPLPWTVVLIRLR